MALSRTALAVAFTFTSTAFAQTYVNQGLIGYASLPADLVDAFGDTVSRVAGESA